MRNRLSRFFCCRKEPITDMIIVFSLYTLTKDHPSAYEAEHDDLNANLRPGVKRMIEALSKAGIPFYIAGPVALSQGYMGYLKLSETAYSHIQYIEPDENNSCTSAINTIANDASQCLYTCFRERPTRSTIEKVILNCIDGNIDRETFILHTKENSDGIHDRNFSIDLVTPKARLYNHHIETAYYWASSQRSRTSRHSLFSDMSSMPGSSVSLLTEEKDPNLFFAEQLIRTSLVHTDIYNANKTEIDRLLSLVRQSPEQLNAALTAVPISAYRAKLLHAIEQLMSTYTPDAERLTTDPDRLTEYTIV